MCTDSLELLTKLTGLYVLSFGDLLPELIHGLLPVMLRFILKQGAPMTAWNVKTSKTVVKIRVINAWRSTDYANDKRSVFEVCVSFSCLFSTCESMMASVHGFVVYRQGQVWNRRLVSVSGAHICTHLFLFIFSCFCVVAKLSTFLHISASFAQNYLRFCHEVQPKLVSKTYRLFLFTFLSWTNFTFPNYFK